MVKHIVAFCGRKYSGKDTAAQVLINNGFKVVKFADPLKSMARAYMRAVGIDDQMIERYVEGDLKEEGIDVFLGCSTRYFLQTLGTNFARNLIGDRFWVNAFMSRVQNYDLVVCTDVRFENEVNAIHQLGGKVYRIDRPMGRLSDTHESETGIDSLCDDGTIDNDGSVDELHEKVKRLVLRT